MRYSALKGEKKETSPGCAPIKFRLENPGAKASLDICASKALKDRRLPVNILLASMVAVALFLPITSRQVYGGEKTRIGAEQAGNADGEITPFEGAKGLECPSDYKKGQYLPNPYKDEKPRFRIDRTNVAKYENRLSPGQIARLKRNPNFYMNVYPTHRNMEFCEEFYVATEKNTRTVRLANNHLLEGFNGGIPFPDPKNGLEAIWNVKRPYMGDDATATECRRVVTPSGKIKKTIRTTYVLTYDERRLKTKLQNPDALSYKLLAYYSYPADEAGTAYLTYGYLDDDRLEDTWLYLPTMRRIRRAPTLTGGAQLDGESTMDDLGFEFRGPINDWTWKLLGKREMYIPVNNYDIWEVGTPDNEECLPQDINPARLRYELRRVWVVEGTARPGLSHPYSKRVGYYDEDTWLPAVADRYDQRGNLWRMIEFYTAYDYCQKMRVVPAILYLNLETGRYELQGGCRTQDSLLGMYDTGLDESLFTVEAMRKEGR